MKTSNNDYIQEIEVVDFCGMTKDKIDKGFIYWFSDIAASLSKKGQQTNLKTFGGHGNGGKFYMRQMFNESVLITYLDNKINIFGFTVDKKYGYYNGFENKVLEPLEAIKMGGLSDKGIPQHIINKIVTGKTGFTVIRGTKPSRTRDTNYRIKLAEKIITNPQAQRLIKHKKIYFQSYPNIAWQLLTIPEIKPKEGFEEPFKFKCPDIITIFDKKIYMINDRYSNNIELKLFTSSIPLTGPKYKASNRIDFLGEIGVIASYHINEIGLFSSAYTEFIYGECICPIMEDNDENYVQNDRVHFEKGQRSEALLHWIHSCIKKLTNEMESKRKKEQRKSDLKNTSHFNKILNTWNTQFMKAMLKDQLFGNDTSSPGIGGNDNASAIIGKQDGNRSGKKASKKRGSSGGTETKKAPQFPRVLISGHYIDPLSDNEQTYECDPRQPTVHQRPIDVPHGIYWINTSKSLAKLILDRETANSSRWRYYLFQRHLDIIIKESIFQLGKKEVNITADEVNQRIEDIISKVHDQAYEDLVNFLFDEDYKI